MTKDIRDGNPPTLLLALDYLNKHSLLQVESFGLEYWEKLTKWYEWFMQTQRDEEAMLFKWHDSLPQPGASFTSGMDDFPRPKVSRGNIDLQSWMYFFSKFMAEAAYIYGEDASKYITNLELIKANFKYYIGPDGTYRDIGNDSSFS